ncbi:hypothetical protein NP233_g1190 [Leucocoprinus birnbaumii]|uniref:Uncharacterized protein n=1 Tax=Leucocoprinus birnbaumii TaxID=56174 RepID=A0AAD5W102_9AGAR|nr:hypothetical protein NP233_g1190 [Leucocoprinus birnbaumii]
MPISRGLSFLAISLAALTIFILLHNGRWVALGNDSLAIHSVSDWYRHLYSTDAVKMDLFDTTYYRLDNEGAKHWDHILPSATQSHLVEFSRENLMEEPAKFTVTMFHQLKCLQIYHQAFLQDTPAHSPVLRHCMNYLRQQILCNVDTRLESVRTNQAQSTRVYSTVCRDWTRVYDAVALTSPTKIK